MRFSAILPLLLAHEAAGRPLYNRVNRVRNNDGSEYGRRLVRGDAPRRIRKESSAKEASISMEKELPQRRHLRIDKRDKMSMSIPFVPVFELPVDETGEPTVSPITPSASPTDTPSYSPIDAPSASPNSPPSISPSSSPSTSPVTALPSASPVMSMPEDFEISEATLSVSMSVQEVFSLSTNDPVFTSIPSMSPSMPPSAGPTISPSTSPNESPTFSPSASPSSDAPTASPQMSMSFNEDVGFEETDFSLSLPAEELEVFTSMPSSAPSSVPTDAPTTSPIEKPTITPSASPSSTAPSSSPVMSMPLEEDFGFEEPDISLSLPAEEFEVFTSMPSGSPSNSPSGKPTSIPTASPIESPSLPPSESPATQSPTSSPIMPMPLEDDFGLVETESSLSLPEEEFDAFSMPSGEEPFFTSMPSLPPSPKPSYEPSKSPMASPTDSPSVKPTTSPVVTDIETASSLSMSMPADDFDEFDGLEEAGSSMSLPKEDVEIISMPDTVTDAPTDEPSSNPSAKPTPSPSRKPTALPSLSPSESLFTESPVERADYSLSMSMPSDPNFDEFDGLDDTDVSMSLPEQDFDVFSVPETEDEPESPAPTNKPSAEPTKTPSKSPIRSPTVSPSSTPSNEPTDEPTASPVQTTVDAPLSLSMSMPSDPNFDEFDGLDDTDVSMSLPEQDFDVFSIPETEKDLSSMPTQSPTIRSKSSKMPIPVTIITLPVPEEEDKNYDMSMSASFSVPLDPEFDGLDDTDEFSISMPEQDFDIFSLPTITPAEPSTSATVQPSSKPTNKPTSVTIITLPVPEEGFDEFDVEVSMSTSFSLPPEQEFEDFEPEESTGISDDGFDVVGGGWWLDEESMSYGDRPISLSMSVPVDPDYGFDSTGDGWWLDEESKPYGDRPMSLSMSMPVDPDYGFDSTGDWWWLNGESMSYGDRPMSLSMSMPIDPDYGLDSTGDWWWLNGESMSYGDRPMSFSLSISMPNIIVDTSDDAPETFSNDVDEFQFTWAD